MCAASLYPVVGLSMYRQGVSWSAWEADAAVVPGSYIDMVEEAGGLPVLIPPLGAAPSAGPAAEAADRCRRRDLDGRCRTVVDHLDALVLIGGGDIVADRYDQGPDAHNGGESEQRDALEWALLAEALGRDMPVLAICRGMQLLNVFLGGDLVQHLPDRTGSTAHQPRPGAFGPTVVLTEPGSITHRILGGRAEVMCSHHQALASLGRGLVVTARSDDGVVEAVELPDRSFVVGVQWHPEESGDLRLFEAMVAAVTVPSPRAEQLPVRRGPGGD